MKVKVGQTFQWDWDGENDLVTFHVLVPNGGDSPSFVDTANHGRTKTWPRSIRPDAVDNMSSPSDRDVRRRLGGAVTYSAIVPASVVALVGCKTGEIAQIDAKRRTRTSRGSSRS
ncbi:MAG: hypothetical protein U0169_10135 [Polyangiaceae bacterium]